MIALAQIILAIMGVFTVICLLCAVTLGRRRPPPADPFFYPFGEMPNVPERAGGALPPPVAGSGRLPISSADSAARTPFGGAHRAR